MSIDICCYISGCQYPVRLSTLADMVRETWCNRKCDLGYLQIIIGCLVPACRTIPNYYFWILLWMMHLFLLCPFLKPWDFDTLCSFKDMGTRLFSSLNWGLSLVVRGRCLTRGFAERCLLADVTPHSSQQTRLDLPVSMTEVNLKWMKMQSNSWGHLRLTYSLWRSLEGNHPVFWFLVKAYRPEHYAYVLCWLYNPQIIVKTTFKHCVEHLSGLVTFD